MPSKDDYKYLAGLFDGEGCVEARVFVGRIGNTAMNLSLRITNTNPVVLYWLENEIGGSVYKNERVGQDRQSTYEWVISGQESEDFAKKILPYSRMKSDQLVVFIELRERIGLFPLGRGKVIPQSEWKKREKLVSKIKSAPYRGSWGRY